MSNDYDPYDDLKKRPDVSFYCKALPKEVGGFCLSNNRTIVVSKSISRIERRSTLAEELAHLDLGHFVINGRKTPLERLRRVKQEEDAKRLAADRLISDEKMIDFQVIDIPLADVAAELDVAEEFVKKKIENLKRRGKWGARWAESF